MERVTRVRSGNRASSSPNAAMEIMGTDLFSDLADDRVDDAFESIAVIAL